MKGIRIKEGKADKYSDGGRHTKRREGNGKRGACIRPRAGTGDKCPGAEKGGVYHRKEG